MFPTQILSRLSRLALLSVFCTGLFLWVGELSMNASGEIGLENGGIESVMAANCGEPGQKPCTEKEAMDNTINSIISFLNLGIGVLTFLITPLIMLAGWLLSPDWTFGEIFGLRPILHQLWILISNVVYVIFGFLLVFIAFANIFGGENAKAYEMKTMLPKLVTGMLIVPFTWFIVSAVLSVSNVLTASVISLPMETIIKSGASSGFYGEPIIPTEIFYTKGLDGGTGSSLGLKNNGEFAATDCATHEQNCLSIEQFLTMGGGGAYNLLSVYAYGIFRIQEYKAITTEQKIKTVIDIASKLGFGVIFFVIFGILVIAIVYALFSRALMLWLYAMFSPIFALMFVLGDKAKQLEKFTIKEFISLALVPVYVSAALAFGLMFLGLVMGATNQGSTGASGKLNSNTVDIERTGDITVFNFGGETGIKLITQGLLDPEVKSGAEKALDLGKGIIGTIIVNTLALVVLWMAVMAALGASKITEAAVAPIKGFGDELGKLAMKAPQYIPIPLGKNKDGTDRSISMAGMGGISSTIKQALDTGASNQGATLGKTFAEGLGLKMSDLGDSLRQTTLSIQGKRDLQSQKADWQKAWSSVGDATNQYNHKDTIIPKYKEMLSATKIPENDKKPFEELLTAGNLDKFVVDFNAYLTNKHSGGIGTGTTADQILKSTKSSAVSTISNITINAHPDGTKTDRDLTIEGNTKKFTFDLSFSATKNADSLKELKGTMKESDLKEALGKSGMESGEVDNLITELKKTVNFFKS